MHSIICCLLQYMKRLIIKVDIAAWARLSEFWKDYIKSKNSSFHRTESLYTLIFFISSKLMEDLCSQLERIFALKIQVYWYERHAVSLLKRWTSPTPRHTCKDRKGGEGGGGRVKNLETQNRKDEKKNSSNQQQQLENSWGSRTTHILDPITTN